MIDFNSTSHVADRVNALMDEAIMAARDREAPRDYLGYSIAGHICDRYLYYETNKVPRKPFEARSLRIFERGDLFEEAARKWLVAAGFAFARDQEPMSGHDDRSRGHCDGIIAGFWHPDPKRCCPIELPALWECKGLGNKYFNDFKKKSLKTYSSTYYAQVQIYMSKLDLDQCLFTAINANTMEVTHKLVKANPDEAKLYLDRVGWILDTAANNEPPPRHTTNRDFWMCKWCDHYELCWR